MCKFEPNTSIQTNINQIKLLSDNIHDIIIKDKYFILDNDSDTDAFTTTSTTSESTNTARSNRIGDISQQNITDLFTQEENILINTDNLISPLTPQDFGRFGIRTATPSPRITGVRTPTLPRGGR